MQRTSVRGTSNGYPSSGGDDWVWLLLLGSVALGGWRIAAQAVFESLGWSRAGSNRRPPACKAGALPTELRNGSLYQRFPHFGKPAQLA